MVFNCLTQTVGREPGDVLVLEASPPETEGVFVFVFRDYPEPSLVTGFTSGLSAANQADWEDTKPELSLTVASADAAWMQALAYLVDWNRTVHSFSPGSLFHYGRAVSVESAMDSFLVFDLAIGRGGEFCNVAVDKDLITFLGVHPLYYDEVAMLQKVGIRKFMGLPEYRLFSTKRPDLSKIYKVGQD